MEQSILAWTFYVQCLEFSQMLAILNCKIHYSLRLRAERIRNISQPAILHSDLVMPALIDVRRAAQSALLISKKPERIQAVLESSGCFYLSYPSCTTLELHIWKSVL